MKVERTKQGTYIIPEMVEAWTKADHLGLEAGEAVSVTKIIDGVSPKPALVAWAASEEAKLWQAAVKSLAVNGVYPERTEDEFMLAVQAQLGDGKMYRQLGSQAANIGSHVHSMIAFYASGDRGPVPTPPGDIGRGGHEAIRIAINSYLDREEARKPKVISQEETLTLRKERVVGTVDRIEEANGVMRVVDWKTSSAIYDDYYLQIAAYAVMAVEAGHPIQEVELVRLPKSEADLRKVRKKHGVPYESVVIDTKSKEFSAAVMTFIRAVDFYYDQRSLRRALKGRHED